jgi:hypothetical protein
VITRKEVYEEPSSLETWFAIPGLGAVQPPPRWKMALVTTPTAYVLILAILAVSPPAAHILRPAPFLRLPVTPIMASERAFGIAKGGVYEQRRDRDGTSRREDRPLALRR